MRFDIVFSEKNLAFESFTPLSDYIFSTNNILVEDYFEFSRYLNPGLDKLVDNPKLSITSAAEFKHRIRFFHFQKVYHVFNFFFHFLIDTVQKKEDRLEIYFYNCNEMLEYDVMLVDHFIDRLSNIPNNITLYFDECNSKIKNAAYVSKNTHQNHTPKVKQKNFWDKSNKEKMFQRAMNLALYEDAIRLGTELFHLATTINDKCFLADKIGIANVLYDRPHLAENYYHFVLNQKCNTEIKIEVLYKLSMLYSRHHPVEKLDAKKAENYLLTARSLIEENKDELGESYTFHKVFNRNGLSLLLHRKGEFETAHHYCIDGHEQILNTYGPLQHILHRSVLIYNSTITATALKKFDQALDQFDYLLKLDPYYPNYWLARANLYSQLGQFDKSVHDYTQALALNPFSEGLYCARGIVYEVMGELHQAKADYEQALYFNPNHVDSLLNYGVILLNENELDHALEVFNKLSLLETNIQHEVFNNIGLVFMEKNDINSAIHSFHLALNLEPDFYTALINLATAYFIQDDKIKALEIINNAIKIDDNVDSLYNRAYLYSEMGQLEAALADIQAILSRDENHVDALELKHSIKTKPIKSY